MYVVAYNYRGLLNVVAANCQWALREVDREATSWMFEHPAGRCRSKIKGREKFRKLRGSHIAHEDEVRIN